MLLLAVIDLIWGGIIVFFQVQEIIKRKKIYIFLFVNLMFSFVYGFLPAIILFRHSFGRSIYEIDNTPQGIFSLFIITIFSIIVFFSMNITYYGIKVNNNRIRVNDSIAKTSGLLMLFLGWISLVLWTIADGGITNFISHADGIRAGYYKLNNPFAFLEHVTRILLFAGVLNFEVFLSEKSLKKITMIGPAILGILGAYLFILAWDSRATFGFFVLMIILVQMDKKIFQSPKVIKREIIKLAIILASILVLIVASQSLMNYFRFGTYVYSGNSLNIFNIIESEFGFILKTQQTVLSKLPLGKDLYFFNDLLNAITSWVPSRFIPFEIPPTLWSHNTLFANGTLIHGTIPTDILSCSLYDLGLIGLIIIPFLYAVLIKKIDSLLYCEKFNLYNSVLKGIISTVVINQISHFSLSANTLAVFYIVLGHIITKVISYVKSR